ncbi:Cap15 family cyclic dinucleotide receptor domain-containing protein [Halodesulfovibrio spirochaetisodalis]|uniref:CD-NTase-associated protein 15 domain-containing protein n=1 Tax=Halodesulfovibrio spirochaetisodalis TaxID=1560234 RepID=A0A1B7XI32_9BACT|nr:hypothetical protein [Halodesulfovibrio spirochaetisodalis]OBQ55187.1 hypothetical protein SP90_04260 [Halodesulfovibrio spirochaetisodalis]
MTSDEVKKVVFLSSCFCIVSTLIIYFLNGQKLTLDTLKNLSSVLSVVSVFWAMYFAFGWKLPYVKKILPKTNLNGTWIGEYKANSEGKEYEGKIGLAIRQKFFSIKITSFTIRFQNYSYLERVVNENENGVLQLDYVYTQDENDDVEERVRKGVTEIKLVAPDKMSGYFWTNANSNGRICVTFKSRNHYNSFEEIENEENE